MGTPLTQTVLEIEDRAQFQIKLIELSERLERDNQRLRAALEEIRDHSHASVTVGQIARDALAVQS